MEPERNSKTLATEGYPAQLSQGSSVVYAPHIADKESDAWDVSWLFSVVRRRRLVIAGVAVATTVISAALILLRDSITPPTYEGTFQLLVEPVTAEDQLARLFVQAQRPTDLGGVNFQDAGLDYETQLRVLESPTVLEPVIQQIQVRYPDVTYESLLKNLEISRVSVERDGREEGTKLLEVVYSGDDTEKVQFILDKLSETYLKYSLEVRRTSISQAVGFIDEQLPRLQEQVSELQGDIQDFRQRYNLIDPDLQSASLSEQLNTLEQNRLTNWTDLAAARSRYATLQQQLANANAVTVLGEAPYYENLLTQFQEIEGQLAVESARLSDQNPALQALYERRQNVLELMQREAQRVLSKSSDDVSALEARDQAIVTAKNQLNQQLQLLPAVTRQYTDLQRELSVSSDILNEFLNRREALRIDAAQRETPWELVTPATLVRDVEGKPINVADIDKRLYLALAVILGTLLGLGVSFLLELMQDTLYSPSELKRLTRMPVLGVIPLRDAATNDRLLLPVQSGLRQLSPVLTTESGGTSKEYLSSNAVGGANSQPALRTTIFTEAFRTLYTNIQSLGGDTDIRSVSISSSVPGEGKSTVAVNLALAAAALGKKVLLIDGDLRNPQIHNYLSLNNDRGFHDLLSSSNLKPEECVQYGLGESNLHVITAGQPSLDPTRLLASQRMKDMFEHFHAAYDFVIVDTPPILGMADTILLSAHTSGALVVVKLGSTSRATISQSIDNLRVCKAPVLGTVANGVREDNVTPYGYYGS
jgi:polysaccharide biosynthesis transport protein